MAAGHEQGERERRRHRARPPLGCTGAKLMTTMLHELERTGGRYGFQPPKMWLLEWALGASSV